MWDGIADADYMGPFYPPTHGSRPRNGRMANRDVSGTVHQPTHHPGLDAPAWNSLPRGAGVWDRLQRRVRFCPVVSCAASRGRATDGGMTRSALRFRQIRY